MVFSVNDRKLIPQLPGVYIYKNIKNNILYIGKAINLKNRINSYFINKKSLSDKTTRLISLVRYIEIVLVESEFEALLLEARLIRKFLPKFNVIWKDDKHYLYIKITKEEFPRILLSRSGTGNEDRYFGPFPSSKTIKDILKIIRNIYPYCTQKRTISKPCFYTHIGLCDPCPGQIKKREIEEYKKLKKQYQINIKNIVKIIDGKYKIIQIDLKRKMQQYSKEQNYEQAAKIRDKIKNLSYLLTDYHRVDNYFENYEFIPISRFDENQELLQILKKYKIKIQILNKIECFDISNISGKYAVGSMVSFINGLSEKKYYRRFHIRSVTTSNDFMMLKEVIERRLKHKEWTYPDLILVDGGKPQLIPIIFLLKQLKISIPILGISKKFEEIVIPYENDFINLRLNRSSKPLQLLQRIRDEAHRFAHDFYNSLRLKEINCLFERAN
jgi:excinuclease ABC subunit C